MLVPETKVLVADKISEHGLSILSAFQVDVHLGMNEDELCKRIPEYSALIVRSETKVTKRVLGHANKLEVIGRAGVGVDNIDVDVATKKGVIVLNSPTGNIVAAAEHTIALIMACVRNVPRANDNLKNGKWIREMGVEVKGKTLGIIGLGKVGMHVARCALGLGMKVIATDPYASSEVAAQNHVSLTSLPSVLQSCDILTIHTPLISSTKGMISGAELAMMKPSSRVVNVARGGLIDETALLEALESGHISGAAVDVFPQEPPAGASLKLIAHPNCICTPHLGASTKEAQIQCSVDVCEQILNVLQGRLPKTAVNVPLHKDFQGLQNYVQLVEKMGEIYTQFFRNLKTFTLTYTGDIAPCAPLFAALIKGLTEHISSTNVNIVNAKLVAKDRGIIVNESHVQSATTSITLESSGSEVITGICLDHGPVITRLGKFKTNFKPQGILLICQNFDRPGMIGSVGAIVGKQGVNISSMTVAPSVEDGQALMILEIDRKVDKDVLQNIAAVDGILVTDLVTL